MTYVTVVHGSFVQASHINKSKVNVMDQCHLITQNVGKAQEKTINYPG
jgi:hypothetical protein